MTIEHIPILELPEFYVDFQPGSFNSGLKSLKASPEIGALAE